MNLCGPPSPRGFKTTVPYAAGQAWAQAFVECRRAPKKVPAPPYHGVAKFPQQLYCSSSDRDGVVGSGNGGGSEQVLLSSYQATLGQWHGMVGGMDSGLS